MRWDGGGGTPMGNGGDQESVIFLRDESTKRVRLL